MATFTSIYTRKTTLWDIVVYKRCDSAIQHGSKRKSHKVVFTNVITGNPAVYLKFLLDEIERRPTEERQLAITKTVFEYIFTDKRGNRLLNNSNFSKTVCAKFFELVDVGHLTTFFPLYKSIWNYAVRNGSFAVPLIL